MSLQSGSRAKFIPTAAKNNFSPIANGHQSKMQQQPDWNGEQNNRNQPFPRPFEVMRLDRENRDHEIIREPRVADEAQVFWKFFTDAAGERDEAERDHQKRHEQVDRQHGVEFNFRHAVAARLEIRPEPLRAGPEKAEPGLERGAEVRLVGSQFVEQQPEIERDDSPDKRDMLEWRRNQFQKNIPIMTHANILTTCHRRCPVFLWQLVAGNGAGRLVSDFADGICAAGRTNGHCSAG